MKKTHVYIDGFNLYYGALKDSPYRWLNLSALSSLLLPENDIIKIKYFTARVKTRPGNPGQASRQELYLRALRTLPNLEIIYGRFSAHRVSMYLADSTLDNPQYADVIKTEEKGSDVNIATDMMDDGCQGLYEVAALVTNDSDLERTVRTVKERYRVPVGIINPNINRPASKALARPASFVKSIRKWHLKECQFPTTIRDAKKRISKPNAWRIEPGE